jgi:hydrogenase-4 membrane subunit HyfE
MPDSAHDPDVRSDTRRQARRLRITASLFGLMVAALAVTWLALTGTPMSLHLVIAVGSAIILAFALAGVLMSLLFLSSRTGIDSNADQPFRE